VTTPLQGPDCTRCGAPAVEHPAGRCPRPPLPREEAHGTGLGSYLANVGLISFLAVVAIVGAVAWLLTAEAATNCSTLAQLGGSTCYPAAVALHSVAGWGALIAGAGAVLAGVMGRRSS
jgi:hypothetical protein